MKQKLWRVWDQYGAALGVVLAHNKAVACFLAERDLFARPGKYIVGPAEGGDLTPAPFQRLPVVKGEA